MEDTKNIEKIRRYVKSAYLRKKWVTIWEKIENRVLDLPEQMQKALLQDVSEAVENRIAVLEKAKGNDD